MFFNLFLRLFAKNCLSFWCLKFKKHFFAFFLHFFVQSELQNKKKIRTFAPDIDKMLQ